MYAQPRFTKTTTLSLLAIVLVLFASPVLAHGDEHGNQQQQSAPLMGDCLGNENCHMMADMMGYGWFGMGSGGLLIGVALWVAVILGIIYLIDRLRQNKNT